MATLRPVDPADAPALAEIYNEGIDGREATFETRRRGADEVVAWIQEGRPFLVAEDEHGTIVGLEFPRFAGQG
jgi:L-amino acid N-acyltransferase YncA